MDTYNDGNKAWCGWKYTVIFYISVVCKYPTCQVHADKLSSPVQTAFCWVILLTKLLRLIYNEEETT